jgi:hypothetical protein
MVRGKGKNAIAVKIRKPAVARKVVGKPAAKVAAKPVAKPVAKPKKR